MSADRFDIYFRGQILPDQDLNAVKAAVARIFKVEPAQVGSLFSGKPVRVKVGVDAETAGRFRMLFSKAGAVIDVKMAGTAPPPPRDPNAPIKPVKGKPATKAPRPSSAAEPASPRPTESDSGTKIPDVSNMTLGAIGIDLDDTPPPPPLRVDTSHLEALPANTGTLEDCVVKKKPAKIPDISYMALLDD